MRHEEDYTYKGHEIVVIDGISDGMGWICDVREDNFDGEFLAGFYDLESKKEAKARAEQYVDQYIYDQTNFTEGISV